ncbi:hypothetical protein CR513_53106, partial [Mucuna pruriens]
MNSQEAPSKPTGYNSKYSMKLLKNALKNSELISLSKNEIEKAHYKPKPKNHDQPQPLGDRGALELFWEWDSFKM